MLSKDRVIEIFKETEVLLEGHFQLTSGRHSNQYMQCAKFYNIQIMLKKLQGLAEEFKDDNIDMVVGLKRWNYYSL